jgi:hypothetical protein
MASPNSTSASDATNPFAGPDPPPATTVAMIGIKAHVPDTLDMEAANFRSWRTLFELTFQKFGLMDHVDGSLDAVLMQDDFEWRQIDACIVSWLYTTVSKSIMDTVYQPRSSAHRV